MTKYAPYMYPAILLAGILVLTSNKPLPNLMLTRLHIALCDHLVIMSWYTCLNNKPNMQILFFTMNTHNKLLRSVVKFTIQVIPKESYVLEWKYLINYGWFFDNFVTYGADHMLACVKSKAIYTCEEYGNTSSIYHLVKWCLLGVIA